MFNTDHHCRNMASQLENAMETLIKVFHTYSSKEGDKYKLSKAELKSLLQGELSVFLAVSSFSHDIWLAGSRLLLLTIWFRLFHPFDIFTNIALTAMFKSGLSWI